MSVRVLGAALVVLLLGAAGGWGYAATRTDEPVPIAAEPLPAQDPRLPVKTYRPDPDDPALKTAVALRTRLDRLTAGDDGADRVRVQLPAPTGWIRYPLAPDEPGIARWIYRDPGVDPDTYSLRVDLYTEQLTVAARIRARMSALSSASDQGNITDLEFENLPEGFLASYVDSEGYFKLSFERFFSGADPDLAHVSVAAVGRERDRLGLSDLLNRISEDLRTG